MIVILGAAAAAGPVIAAAPAAKKLLVVSVTKGFRHESIPPAERVIEAIGKESGAYTVDFARTDEELLAKTTPAALEGFDGVFFANTTGDLPLGDRQGFLDWITKGHAFMGMHSATDTFHGFPPFIAMIGAEFDYHKAQVKVEPKVEDARSAATRGIAPGFAVLDEIYIMKSFDKARVHPLLSLDKHPNTGEPGYFPLAWTREEGKGRVFYTAFGHREDVLEADWYKQHLLGGIRWALRLDGGR
ncbi:MAG TPA: ThuA domain-containing protein [Vicinamibacteria bacterium]|nr:ThuA domain-containing protein [Vicinamibacteria bacterium]